MALGISIYPHSIIKIKVKMIDNKYETCYVYFTYNNKDKFVLALTTNTLCFIYTRDSNIIESQSCQLAITNSSRPLLDLKLSTRFS